MRFHIERARWEWDNEEEKIIKEYPCLKKYRFRL